MQKEQILALLDAGIQQKVDAIESFSIATIPAEKLLLVKTLCSIYNDDVELLKTIKNYLIKQKNIT